MPRIIRHAALTDRHLTVSIREKPRGLLLHHEAKTEHELETPFLKISPVSTPATFLHMLSNSSLLSSSFSLFGLPSLLICFCNLLHGLLLRFALLYVFLGRIRCLLFCLILAHLLGYLLSNSSLLSLCSGCLLCKSRTVKRFGFQAVPQGLSKSVGFRATWPSSPCESTRCPGRQVASPHEGSGKFDAS